MRKSHQSWTITQTIKVWTFLADIGDRECHEKGRKKKKKPHKHDTT